MIKKIADVLNVSADELLGIPEEPYILAAHFDREDYTEQALKEIKDFAAYVKTKRDK